MAERKGSYSSNNVETDKKASGSQVQFGKH